MRAVLVAAALIALAGCETMPQWAQDLRNPEPTPAAAPAPVAPVENAATRPQRYQATPEQQLLELERRLAATAQTQGLAQALAPALDPVDGFIIRPGVIFQGQDSIPAALGEVGTTGPVFWQADRVYVSEDGDMGVTSGRYVQVVENAPAIQGRYLVVWRKDAAGEWKALTETRIPDPPPAPARRRR